MKYATTTDKHYDVFDGTHNNFPIIKLQIKIVLYSYGLTYPLLPNGIETLKRWGFRYVTVAFTWIKTNRINKEPFMGMVKLD